MGVKHDCFSQFSDEKELCFAPIQTNLDGGTIIHNKLFLLKYFKEG
jgi:hypothetical protein